MFNFDQLEQDRQKLRKEIREKERQVAELEKEIWLLRKKAGMPHDPYRYGYPITSRQPMLGRSLDQKPLPEEDFYIRF